MGQPSGVLAGRDEAVIPAQGDCPTRNVPPSWSRTSDGTNVRPVTDPILDISSGDWSGDGAFIALSALDTTTAASEDYHLVVSDIARGTTTVLDVGMSLSDVKWLPPDGRDIVFRGQSGLSSALLWRSALTGPVSARSRLGMARTIPAIRNPFCRPTVRLLAYVSWDDNWALVVHVRELASDKAWAIPTSERLADLGSPMFSPDGRHLLYTTARPGRAPAGLRRCRSSCSCQSTVVTKAGRSAPSSRSWRPSSRTSTAPSRSTVRPSLMVDRASNLLDASGGRDARDLEPWASDDLPGTQRLRMDRSALRHRSGGGCPR